MTHELILTCCLVGDRVHLDGGLEALEGQISLRIHLIFSLRFIKSSDLKGASQTLIKLSSYSTLAISFIFTLKWR